MLRSVPGWEKSPKSPYSPGKNPQAFSPQYVNGGIRTKESPAAGEFAGDFNPQEKGKKNPKLPRTWGFCSPGKGEKILKIPRTWGFCSPGIGEKILKIPRKRGKNPQNPQEKGKKIFKIPRKRGKHSQNPQDLGKKCPKSPGHYWE